MPETGSKMLSGSCNCGAVKFCANGPLRPIVACHCAQCRKQTGHFMAASAALTQNFELTETRGLKWYQSGKQTRRGFCAECGSTLFFEREGSDRISFAVGTIDGPTGLQMPVHIYAAEKGDYYELPAGADLHDQDNPELMQLWVEKQGIESTN